MAEYHTIRKDGSMNLIQASILGLIQGFTEWLPVSSSGHLVVAQEMMDLTIPVALDVMLHTGTLLAVVIFFWKDICKILKSVLAFKTKDENFKLFLYVLVGTIPTVIIGFTFLNFFESLFSDVRAVGVGFIITGALLLLSKLKNGSKRLGWINSILIGIMQGISIAPGISRSGSTVSAGLLSGIKKEDVFRYSFLLSIPAIIGANVVEWSNLQTVDLGIYSVVGMVVSAVSGYLAIKIVYKTLLSRKFYLFSIYCFLAGAIVFVLI